jgi:hypothetical protein
MSGIQLLGLGILGAYISRIYEEAKSRPKFIVETIIGVPGQVTHAESASEVFTRAQSG